MKKISKEGRLNSIWSKETVKRYSLDDVNIDLSYPSALTSFSLLNQQRRKISKRKGRFAILKRNHYLNPDGFLLDQKW